MCNFLLKKSWLLGFAVFTHSSSWIFKREFFPLISTEFDKVKGIIMTLFLNSIMYLHAQEIFQIVSVASIWGQCLFKTFYLQNILRIVCNLSLFILFKNDSIHIKEKKHTKTIAFQHKDSVGGCSPNTKQYFCS